jgi:hypothetical protein
MSIIFPGYFLTMGEVDQFLFQVLDLHLTFIFCKNFSLINSSTCPVLLIFPQSHFRSVYQNNKYLKALSLNAMDLFDDFFNKFHDDIFMWRFFRGRYESKTRSGQLAWVKTSKKDIVWCINTALIISGQRVTAVKHGGGSNYWLL